MINPFNQGPTTEITITAVDNGWIVQMPPPPADMDEDRNMQMLTHVAKEVGKAMHGDPVLNSISEDKTSVRKEDASPMHKVSRNTSMHVFTTFDEVLSFLKAVVEE